MIPRVIAAEYVNGFTLRLRFDDGSEGEIDFSEELAGPVFAPLRESSYFRRFSVHPELHTLTWPNGADFAPEFLYDRVVTTAAARRPD